MGSFRLATGEGLSGRPISISELRKIGRIDLTIPFSLAAVSAEPARTKTTSHLAPRSICANDRSLGATKTSTRTPERSRHVAPTWRKALSSVGSPKTTRSRACAPGDKSNTRRQRMSHRRCSGGIAPKRAPASKKRYNAITAPSAASAADLKFLHRLRQTHFRNFKSKSGTRIICLLVPLLLPKFVSEGAAMYHELRKRGTSQRASLCDVILFRSRNKPSRPSVHLQAVIITQAARPSPSRMITSRWQPRERLRASCGHSLACERRSAGSGTADPTFRVVERHSAVDCSVLEHVEVVSRTIDDRAGLELGRMLHQHRMASGIDLHGLAAEVRHRAALRYHHGNAVVDTRSHRLGGRRRCQRK